MSISMSMSNLSETEKNHPSIPLPPSQRQQNTTASAAAASASAATTPNHYSTSKKMKSPSPIIMKSSQSPLPFMRLLSNDPLLHQELPRRTHPLVWCSAILCLIFCLIIIFFGIITLIIYLVVKPKHPSFDVPNATLNALYFDSPYNFNGDFTLLANFTNPNRKLNLQFDHLGVQLFFVDRLIATQTLKPFSQKPGQGRLEMIHLISSLVYLPPNPAIQLQRQVQSNRIEYNIRASFRVTAKLGSARFKYWLHSTCQLQMTSPPKGILVSRGCTTKK